MKERHRGTFPADKEDRSYGERNFNGMKITYHEQSRIFKLDTPHTSYCIGIVDEENFLDMFIMEGNFQRIILPI